jgi:hypothetical protein
LPKAKKPLPDQEQVEAPEAAPQDFYTPEEIKQAIESFSKADLTRMNEIARIYAGSDLKHDREDLLQEAITRILAGKRNWPRDLAPARFLGGVMRGIASEKRQRLSGKRELETEHAASVNERLGFVPEKAIMPDQIVWRQQVLESARNALKPDPIALDIFEKELIGMRGQERQGELDKTAYETVLKRIRRRLARVLR